MATPAPQDTRVLLRPPSLCQACGLPKDGAGCRLRVLGWGASLEAPGQWLEVPAGERPGVTVPGVEHSTHLPRLRSSPLYRPPETAVERAWGGPPSASRSHTPPAWRPQETALTPQRPPACWLTSREPPSWRPLSRVEEGLLLGWAQGKQGEASARSKARSEDAGMGAGDPSPQYPGLLGP